MGIVCYDTHMGINTYDALCEAVESCKGTIKLDRGPQGWGVLVTLRPATDDPTYRAAGVLFPDLGELDRQCEWLLTWVGTSRPDAVSHHLSTDRRNDE